MGMITLLYRALPIRLVAVLLTGVSSLLVSPAILGGQQVEAPRVTACGAVQKVTCDDKEPRFTTLELKPKSKMPVSIPRSSRAQFTPAPEEMYRDTEVCVTGRVETYAGRRRLVVTDPQDITIRKRIKLPEMPWSSPYVHECDEDVTMPVLIREVEPQYTREAMQARITGIVRLQAIVDPDGEVGEIRIRRSLDDELGLDDAAIKAVRQWRFRPGTQKGQPVPVLVDIEVSFRLK